MRETNMEAAGEGFDIGCDFGGVSLGKETCRVGVKLERSSITLQDADTFLCGMRLTGKLVVGGKQAAPGQTTLPGMEDAGHEVAGVFDVKRFGVSAKEITFGATFAMASVDPRDLAKLANSSGRLVVTDADVIPDDEAGDDEGHDDHEDVGPIPKSKPMAFDAPKSPACLDDLKRDDGAAMPLSALEQFGTTRGITKSVTAAVGGKTIGHLEKFMAANPEYWHRDIPGVGPEKLTQLQDAHLAFRQQNPMVSDEDRSDVDYAYHQGREAWDEQNAAGIVAANPYPEGDRRAKAWKFGWDAGAAESPADEVTVDDGEAGDSVDVD